MVGSAGGVASVVATTAGTSLTVASAMVLLLNDDRITITVVSVNQKGKKLKRCQLLLSRKHKAIRATYECNEEEDDVHDGESEAGLEHGTCLVDMERPIAATLTTVVAEGTQTEVDISAAEIGTIIIRYAAQLIDSGNQSAHKCKVDQGDKQGRVPSAQVGHKRCKSPCCCQNRRDEEQQNVGRCELVVDDETVDEPRKHAQDWDEGEYLRDAEREE